MRWRFRVGRPGILPGTSLADDAFAYLSPGRQRELLSAWAQVRGMRFVEPEQLDEALRLAADARDTFVAETR